MVSTTKNTVHLMIDGYEISADFTDGRNQDVSMRVKQIMLSAFANTLQKTPIIPLQYPLCRGIIEMGARPVYLEKFIVSIHQKNVVLFPHLL